MKLFTFIGCGGREVSAALDKVCAIVQASDTKCEVLVGSEWLTCVEPYAIMKERFGEDRSAGRCMYCKSKLLPAKACPIHGFYGYPPKTTNKQSIPCQHKNATLD